MTWQGVLALTASSQSLFVTDGLTLETASAGSPGSIDLSGASYSSISVLGSGTLDNATLNFGGGYYDSLTTGTGNDSGNTLTLGSGFTVDVSGGIDYLGVQDWAYYYVGDLGDTLDNAGQININGGSLTVDYGTFNNTGTLNVTGGVLAIGGAFSNSGSIIVGAGGTLDLQGTETTAQLGGMTFDGGTLEIGGVLDNTGATLDVGTGTAQGSLLLSGGTIEGGTIEAAGGGFASRNGTLDGVTWQGVLALTASSQSLFVTDGLTLQTASAGSPGSIDLSGASYSSISVLGSGTLDNATLNFGGGYYNSLTTGTGNDSGNTLTLGSGFTVDVSGGIDYLGVQTGPTTSAISATRWTTPARLISTAARSPSITAPSTTPALSTSPAACWRSAGRSATVAASLLAQAGRSTCRAPRRRPSWAA